MKHFKILTLLLAIWAFLCSSILIAQAQEEPQTGQTEVFLPLVTLDHGANTSEPAQVGRAEVTSAEQKALLLGGFTITNQAVGSFASWAADPDVSLITGDFNADGRTDLALVRRKAGWTTIPIAFAQ